MGNCVGTNQTKTTTKTTQPSPVPVPAPKHEVQTKDKVSQVPPQTNYGPGNSTVRDYSPEFGPKKQSQHLSKISNTLLVDPVHSGSNIYVSQPLKNLNDRDNHPSHISFQQIKESNKIKNDSILIDAYFDSAYDKNKKPIQVRPPSLIKPSVEVIEVIDIPDRVEDLKNTQVIQIFQTIHNPVNAPLLSSYKSNFDWVKDIAQEDFETEIQTFVIPNIDLKIS